MNPYRILGIDKTATEEEIKTAYRTLAKQYHPDTHPEDQDAAERMNEINAAYNLIRSIKSNPEIDESSIDFEDYNFTNTASPEEYSRNLFSIFSSPVFRRAVILLLIGSIILISIASSFFQSLR